MHTLQANIDKLKTKVHNKLKCFLKYSKIGTELNYHNNKYNRKRLMIIKKLIRNILKYLQIIKIMSVDPV
jgi:hypothetical protein